ncbi:hypothetical protein BB559_002994 [Furculomyces boomerangus]|uniref:Polyprenol reductase n=1 Tax=Furculomyces boomerangus TaxID=61424 RepID=A0A2T9YQ68_9FUNG|nr:hypothetical protein BB559_002994 [Furculomyces boomerangus]
MDLDSVLKKEIKRQITESKSKKEQSDEKSEKSDEITTTKQKESTKKNPEQKSILEKLESLEVSKNYFLFFYIIGTISSSLILREILGWDARGEIYLESSQRDPFFFMVWRFIECKFSPKASSYMISGPVVGYDVCEPFVEVVPKTTFIALGLYATQVYLRLLESIFYQPPTNSKIHLGHFIMGILFYLVTPMAIIVDSVYSGSKYMTSFGFLV